MPMSVSPNANNLLLGRGSIYVDPLSALGARQGEFNLGNCENCSLTYADEKKTKYSSQVAESPLLKSALLRRTVSLRITGGEFSDENLKLLLMGGSVPLTQGSGTLTDAALAASAVPGRWYDCGKRDLSAVTVVINSADLATNGAFATDTGWTKGTGWTIAAGVAASDGTQTAASSLSQTIAGLVAGASYEVKFTVTAVSAGTIAAKVGGGTAGTSRSTAATFTETLVAGATTLFELEADAEFVGSIDNVTVRLVGTLTTDYTVDADRGRIYIVPGGRIQAGDVLTICATYAAIVSRAAISGATVSVLEAFVRFVGNPAAGPALEVECWKVSFNLEGEVGLISDDYGTWTLKGEVLDDSANHPTAPYFRVIEPA